MTARTDDLLIGVDLGTSVVKAALYTPDGAALATTARATTLRQPAPGVAEQDPDEFVAAALAVIREVVAASGCASGAVAAIGFAGQMGGLLGIDKEWQAITPWYVSTLDTRYVPYVARMEAQAGPAMLALGGAVPIAGPRMLWWQQEHPALDARIAKVLILANFVAGRLAGLTAEEAFVDPSYLTWFGLSDTANRIWSPELVEQVGLDATKLPRIVPAATRIGSLTQEAAAACGLRAGVALVAGAGDQVAGFLGAGLVDAGQVIDVAGTFPVLATPLDRFLPGARGATFQALAGPLDSAPWYAMMYIGGGGLTHRWFVENFGGGSAEGTASYAALDAQAAAVAPGAEGLIFLPHLGGRASPVDPDQRGAWLGITWTHGPAHFYRAVLESIAYDYAGALAELRALAPGLRVDGVRVIGGGARSRVWNQIKADVLGIPYAPLRRPDVTTWGCAILAGHAAGIFPDMAAVARRSVDQGEMVAPRPAFTAHYAGYVQAYQQALADLRGVHTALARLRSTAPPAVDDIG